MACIPRRKPAHCGCLGLVVLSCLGPPPVAAQSSRAVSVAAGTHALTVPWHPGPVTDRLNPAFMVGTDGDWTSGNRWNLTWAVNLAFFQHHWWMTGLSLEPEVGVGRSLPGGMRADLRLGLGYLHYFWRRKGLELKDGRYVEAPDRGRPSVVLPLSLTLGYRGDARSPPRAAPFVTARWSLQGMFLEEVPAMTHLLLMAGVRVRSRRARPEEGGGR